MLFNRQLLKFRFLPNFNKLFSGQPVVPPFFTDTLWNSYFCQIQINFFSGQPVVQPFFTVTPRYLYSCQIQINFFFQASLLSSRWTQTMLKCQRMTSSTSSRWPQWFLKSWTTLLCPILKIINHFSDFEQHFCIISLKKTFYLKMYCGAIFLQIASQNFPVSNLSSDLKSISQWYKCYKWYKCNSTK